MTPTVHSKVSNYDVGVSDGGGDEPTPSHDSGLPSRTTLQPPDVAGDTVLILYLPALVPPHSGTLASALTKHLVFCTDPKVTGIFSGRAQFCPFP